MDLRLYFQLFWAPAIASAALLALQWMRDGSAERGPRFLASWFVLALIAQYMGTPTSVTWVVGLVAQTILAVTLLLKMRIDEV